MDVPPPCKVCGSRTAIRHVRKNIPYYSCSQCHLLFNTHWDDTPLNAPDQIAANDRRRATQWPAGEADHMYRKGWETLEYMGWPPAWWSRHVHSTLRHVPGYQSLVRQSLKNKFRKLLDFGCGHGVTVRELRQRDNFDIVGLDPFAPVDEPYIIRQSLLKHHFPNNTFNGIFSIETLEHISNILDTFRELNRILAPRGVLLVQTRRVEDPDYQEHQDRWFYLDDPTTHVTIYSEPAMRIIARQSGFSHVSFRGIRYARFVK